MNKKGLGGIKKRSPLATVVQWGLGLEGEDRFPAGPRALLSWFQRRRKGLGSCNRFEELI